jgi:hypothetical protein
MDPISSSLAGMNAAADRFDRASYRLIKSVEGPGEDTAGAIVDMTQSQLAFVANAAVLHTSTRMTKSLLDILA